MVPHWLLFAAAYLLFGITASHLMRKAPPEDWAERILASTLGPPLFLLIAAAVLARFVWVQLRRARHDWPAPTS
jgi:hypothetical protein